jgi:hypothetical protein
VEHLPALATLIRSGLSKIIVGQQEVIDQLVVVLVCSGHGLI